MPDAVEVVRGYLCDPDNLGPPFAGADRVFLFPFEGEVEGVIDIMRTPRFAAWWSSRQWK